MTDLAPLHSAIETLARPVEWTTDGFRKLSAGDPAQLAQAVCAEIARTHLPRRLVFRAASGGIFGVVAKAGRVFGRLSPDLKGIDAAGPDDSKSIGAAFAYLLSDAGTIEVQSTRLATPLEGTELGCRITAADMKVADDTAPDTDRIDRFLALFGPLAVAAVVADKAEVIREIGDGAHLGGLRDMLAQENSELTDDKEVADLADSCMVFGGRGHKVGWLICARSGSQLIFGIARPGDVAAAVSAWYVTAAK